jgi:protein-disulfide isomerase/uncharacterized membrane protein
VNNGYTIVEKICLAKCNCGLAVPKVAFALLAITLCAYMLAALLLVLAHLDAITLPGCGAASNCTRANESRWGKLPGTQWPLSFLGFTYFQALLATFIYSGGRLPKLLRAIMGVGGVASILLTSAMVVEGYVCGYCLLIHVLNIAFVIGYRESRWLSKQSPTPRNNRCHSFAVFAATALATTLLLAVVDRRMTRTAEQTRAEQLQQALDQATAGTEANRGAKPMFTPGRYYFGSSTAPVHVVVVSDYQCPSCRTIDAQLRAAIAGRDDISISARHFPFCTDCNPHIEKTRHPSACRAALAAEAAGIVGGGEAFWRMHDWLFEHRGEFTDDELQEFGRDLGLDIAAFLSAMRTETTLELVRSDAAAADAAGLRFTPMIFINGRAIDVGQ